MLPAALLSSAIVTLGFKGIRLFVDSVFRDKVQPVPGAVLYCDLWVAAEHSGIYVDDGRISNIEVEGLADSAVWLCGPDSFTSKSVLGKSIYVSCDKYGSVGDVRAAESGLSAVGQRSFYGLVFKNCHQFSTSCVRKAKSNESSRIFKEIGQRVLPPTDWEPTLAELKKSARIHYGATKWRLWDWQPGEGEPPIEPDWRAIHSELSRMLLNDNNMGAIRRELKEVMSYELEISDENVPQYIHQHLNDYRCILGDISAKYAEVKSFLGACPGADFSYADLQEMDEDFKTLAAEISSNKAILALLKKLGRNHISHEQKKSKKIPEAGRNEVYGIHRSDEVTRLLPVELVNFEDEALELLFYARLLEKNLLTYELAGVDYRASEINEARTKKTGPVVACLDTSGSMQGLPIQKAKALLLAVSSILKKEGRSLHVLLFGSFNELAEFSVDETNDAVGLLRFLKQGFGGGTDFETPLVRAIEIIESVKNFSKADILMISDGGCSLSDSFIQDLRVKKSINHFRIYSVLCTGFHIDDKFSDEVVTL